MDINKAIRIIRKELLVKDEIVKARDLLKEVNLPGFEQELKDTENMMAHLTDKSLYEKIYKDDSCRDYEKIEPEKYSEKANEIYPRYAWVLQEMREDKAKSMADLSCYVGSLVMTSALERESLGNDMTTLAIEAAKKRAKNLKSTAKFQQGDLMDYKGKHDAIIAFEVLEHLPDPKKAIKHLSELTNPNGWVYITTPNGPFMDGDGNIDNWSKADGQRGHVYAFTKEILEDLLKDYEVSLLRPMQDGLIWIKYRKKVDNG